MLPWHGTRIFKHCAKRVSCLQHCLEFILYFLCKRALTLMSIPHLGSHQGHGERRETLFLPLELPKLPSFFTWLLQHRSREKQQQWLQQSLQSIQGSTPIPQDQKRGRCLWEPGRTSWKRGHCDRRHKNRRTGLRFWSSCGNPVWFLVSYPSKKREHGVTPSGKCLHCIWSLEHLASPCETVGWECHACFVPFPEPNQQSQIRSWVKSGSCWPPEAPGIHLQFIPQPCLSHWIQSNGMSNKEKT